MNAEKNPRAFIESMAFLCMDPKFQDFVEQIRQQKDQCVRDLVADETIGSIAKIAATMGEVRCYLSILDAHQSFMDNAAVLAAESA